MSEATMTGRRGFLRLALGAAACGIGEARAQSAGDIIAAADRVRNPGEPFRSTTTLIEYRSGKARSKTVLGVYVKEDKATGQFRNVVRYIDPPRDAGKLVLRTGNTMWFYDPSSKASIRVSAQQRLLGQAAIGDVISVNLAKDYNGKLVGEAEIQDAERKPRACWHLDLAAANDGATYSRIEYWVEKETSYPIRGRFYADSGRLLKVAYYGKYQSQLGGMRPTETIIIDSVDSALVTTVGFADFRFQEIPETWFQREFLPRIGAE